MQRLAVPGFTFWAREKKKKNPQLKSEKCFRDSKPPKKAGGHWRRGRRRFLWKIHQRGGEEIDQERSLEPEPSQTETPVTKSVRTFPSKVSGGRGAGGPRRDAGGLANRKQIAQQKVLTLFLRAVGPNIHRLSKTKTGKLENSSGSLRLVLLIVLWFRFVNETKDPAADPEH